MKRLIFVLLLAKVSFAQQCSTASGTLFQDDLFVSGSCSPSVFNGDIVTVKETRGYNISCTTTSGNSNPNNTYFSDKLVLSGNGQRFCGDLFTTPFNCDPRFTFDTTVAQTPTDSNTFFFREFDRAVSTSTGSCSELAFQSLFRACSGQPCDGSTPNFCPTPPLDQQFTDNNPADSPDCEPLIVDVAGEGFHLTNAANGVVFDIFGNRKPFRLPWLADARNGFLVLDRNGNGIIDDGTELFGNMTPQPSGVRPNGFLALAQYDTPENGGNGDGVIDSHDMIFSQLRVWIDANHDGISQPGELHTLPELGIYSISLDYKLSRRTDEFGNVFRYRATINPGQNGDSDAGRKIYDVFFVSK
jgi:hypothetical protein